MNNAENNPSQAKQNAIEANTPGTTPAQETSRADPARLSAELGSPDEQKPVSHVDEDDPDPLPDIDLDGITVDSGDPVQRANSPIVSVDSANMGASDNTVDTDDKGLEAMRGEPLQRDNVIGSNTTLINNVVAPAQGLVEHPCHVVKNLFRHRKVRYKGLAKNTAQLFSLFALANLVIAKKQLLSTHGSNPSSVRKMEEIRPKYGRSSLLTFEFVRQLTIAACVVLNADRRRIVQRLPLSTMEEAVDH